MRGAACARCHYKATINYLWTDFYEFDVKDASSDQKANLRARILQQANWAKQFDTSIAMQEEVEGVVTLDPLPADCFPARNEARSRQV